MKIKFSFKVPQKFSITEADEFTLNISAEVLGVCSPQETCFLHEITGTGVVMLWGIKPCQELFDLVTAKACGIARAIHQSENVVTVAEAYYTPANN